MKRLLCCLLGIALLLSLFTGCGGGKPAPISEGGADGLLSHLIGSSNEEYLLTEDAELDLTDAHISCDRTVLLQEGVTLKLIGTFTPGEGCIAVRAGYEGGDKPILDLSGLTFELAATQEATNGQASSRSFRRKMSLRIVNRRMTARRQITGFLRRRSFYRCSVIRE